VAVKAAESVIWQAPLPLESRVAVVQVPPLLSFTVTVPVGTGTPAGPLTVTS
jgi:hypothetical protein